MRALLTAVALGGQRSRWALLSWLVLLGCVVVAPLSTKVAGAAGLLLVLMGLGALCYRPVPGTAPGDSAAARGWLLACVIGMSLSVLGVVIWHENWTELHAPARLLLTAGATLAVVRRFAPSTFTRDALAHALTLACLVALGVVLSQGASRDNYPTNAIPWAVSMAFLVCLLLPHTVDLSRPVRCRLVWLAGVAVGVLAVLLSQSRGAYGVLLWVLLFYGVMLWRRRRVTRLGLGMVLGFLALPVAVLALLPHSVDQLTQRMEKAADEYRQTDVASEPGHGANSSVGARIYLWKLAASSIAESPLIGIGVTERLRRIKAEGVRLNAPVLGALGHVHNQYLQSAMDHGVIGLAADLAWLIGLAVTAWRVARRDAMAGWQLCGLLFMHASGSLTNVNFAHNYYGAMLALCVALVLLAARPRVDAAAV